GVGPRALQEPREDLAALLAGGAVQAAAAVVDALAAVRPDRQQHVERGLDVAARGDRDPVLLLRRIVERLRRRDQLVPRRWRLQALLLEGVLAVHEQLH